MKYIILIISMALYSCANQDPSLAVAVLADRTEPSSISKPNIQVIKYLSSFESYPNRRIEFSYQNIGNTDFNPLYIAQIPEGNVLGNKLERSSSINSFFKVIDSLFQYENSIQTQYRNSSILNPLVAELHRMQTLNTDEKVILLYSDLREHSLLMNGYSDQVLQKLEHAPQLIVNQLHEELSLSDFSGITLVIVHYPSSSDHHKFKLFLDLYRKLFEDTHLTIQVGLDKQLN